MTTPHRSMQIMDIYLLVNAVDAFCSVFLFISQVMVTTTTSTPPVAVVCSGTLFITMTVALVPTSGGLTTLGQYSVVLPPKMILGGDTMRGLSGLTTLPQQQPWSQLTSQAYTYYCMGTPQMSFYFRIQPPTNFFYYMLVYIMVFAFFFQDPT